MSFQVRPARHDDIDKIVPWTTDTFAWGDYVPERLPGWLDNPDSFVVVCVDEADLPVAVSHTTMLSPDEAWLEAARVHPDHRRAGMGSAMNKAGTEWAKERGAKVARLATEVDNTAARAQVEAIGYRHTSSWAYASVKPGRQLRLDDDRRLRPSPIADVDSAWMTWATSDLAYGGRELIAHGWRWRKARFDDLTTAATNGELYQSPSGWVMVSQPEPDWMRTGWITTTPEVAPLLVDALLDLGTGRGVSEIDFYVPWVPWMVETLARAGGEPREMVIYALGL